MNKEIRQHVIETAYRVNQAYLDKLIIFVSATILVLTLFTCLHVVLTTYDKVLSCIIFSMVSSTITLKIGSYVLAILQLDLLQSEDNRNVKLRAIGKLFDWCATFITILGLIPVFTSLLVSTILLGD